MCIICVKPAGKNLPSKKQLRNCYQTNSDGIGIALFKENWDQVLIKKGFVNWKELRYWLRQNVQPEDTLLIHFRNATSGLLDSGNCHPFPVSANDDELRATEIKTDLAVAHNGVFFDYSIKNCKLNDTQLFIKDILTGIKNLIFENKGVKKLLKKYLDGNKLAFINNKGEYLLFGEFIEDNGLFWSNSGYKYSFNTAYTMGHYDYGYPYYIWHSEEFKCESCGKKIKEDDVETYDAFGICLECYKKQLTEIQCTECGRFLKKEEFYYTSDDYNICNDCIKKMMNE